MAEQIDYGFKDAQYYYWALYDDGSMEISNGEYNFVKKPYPNFDKNGRSILQMYGTELAFDSWTLKETDWDYPKKKKRKPGWYRHYYYGGWRYWDGYYYEYVEDENGEYVDYTGCKHPTVFGSGAALTGGAGNDSIFNGGSNVKINGGAGNDSISNRGANSKINDGAGDDIIENMEQMVLYDEETCTYEFVMADSTKINGGVGNDFIYNHKCNRVTIYGSGDNDTINNSYGNNVKIDGGAGDDYIQNYDSDYSGSDDPTLIGGADNDTVYNRGIYYIASETNGSYITVSAGNHAKIDGGTGHDSIRNEGG